MYFKKIFGFCASLTLALGMGGAFAAPSFAPSSQPTGWIARPTLTDTQVSSGNEVYFRGTYRMNSWDGDVRAHHVYADGVVPDTNPWSPNTAASLLRQRAHTDRKIVTLSGGVKVPFRWASLSAAHKTALHGDATRGEAILNYLRGQVSNEKPDGYQFRARRELLGDIIHSTLYYWKHASGVERLYVGANDGMLHVFDAQTGAEVFAYVPSMLIPNLNRLVADPYVHTAFVDGPLTMARVTLSGTAKTLLVGGLGAGGKGLFALDVTDPTPADEAAAASKILWEITSASANYANLGYTYAMPRIARLNGGAAAVVVGNGYVNGGNGRSVLYLINLETGARIAEIDTGSGSLASPGGLSSPTLLDADGNGTADYAYAGDLDGKLWKFDLTSFTASLLHTTAPAQAITVAPVVRPHPKGGYLVAFGTGRILTAADATDGAVHYVYGIWDKDGTTVAADALLTQTLTETTFGGGDRVRTLTATAPDWNTHRGWKVALPAGERVVGEAPFHNLNRYYFTSTNPTIAGVPAGENWLNEFDFVTGGSPPTPIFDLDNDGGFTEADKATNGGIPVSKFIKPGVLSQPVLVFGASLNTTVYNWHDNVPPSDAEIITPEGPGVSAGHFDYDIYYHTGSTTTATYYTPSATCRAPTTKCADPSLFSSEAGDVSSVFCEAIDPKKIDYNKYAFLLSEPATVGTTICDKKKKLNRNITYTCCQLDKNATESVSNGYDNMRHVHEYDDKYDVTGVNMLNASDSAFNLANVPVIGATTSFKILVANQYLNPASTLSVGGQPYESVKTYGNLASQTDAATLLASLPVHTPATITTLIFNLPLDAFSPKDWWGDGGLPRAGLIPTQTGCVNKVYDNGTPRGDSKYGPNGERFNGALMIQLIRHDTPASALELNNTNTSLPLGERVKYGWRVKTANFNQYVFADYTAFWHHPNKKCYGDAGWVQDPPEDPASDAKVQTAAAGSADPKDGIFAGGSTITSVVTTTSGDTTTTLTTYANSLRYIYQEQILPGGRKLVRQIMLDTALADDPVTIAGVTGTIVWTMETMIGGDGGDSLGDAVSPPISPFEEPAGAAPGQREAWRELTQ